MQKRLNMSMASMMTGAWGLAQCELMHKGPIHDGKGTININDTFIPYHYEMRGLPVRAKKTSQKETQQE